MRAQISFLPDGRRLHLHDGPIDLILQAFGDPRDTKVAYDAAIARFVSVLDELCAELKLLRSEASSALRFEGVIAKRMMAAVSPYTKRTFITPMAAVAGAVAEEILQAMTANAELSKAYVNNGGDIALHLQPGEEFTIGMIERPDRASLFGTAILTGREIVRGIATSGWRGRSFSLGIADSVTVLAKSAAAADAAATVIANAVNLPGHPAIQRAPACSIAPDNDLGHRLVTHAVGYLSERDVTVALRSGAELAEDLRSEGLIHSAVLHLRDETRVVGGIEANQANRLELSGSLAHA